MNAQEGDDPSVVLAEAGRAYQAGRYAEAARGFATAAALLREQGDGRRQALALLLLAEVQKAEGDLVGAYASLHEASRSAALLEHLEKGDVWAALGTLCLDMGRAEEAEQWLRFAVEGSVGGKPQVMSARLALLGRALKELGRYPEALSEIRGAAAIARILPPINAALAKIELADLLRFLGELGEAKEHLEDVLRHFELEPVRRAFAVTAARAYMQYGRVLIDLGRVDEAAEWMQKSGSLACDTGAAARIVFHTDQASVLHQLGRVAQARPFCVEAARLARTTPGISPRFAANAYLELATNQLFTERHRQAEETLRLARELATQANDTVLQYNVAVVDCELALAQWDLAAALAAARRVIAIQLEALASNPFLHGIRRTMMRTTRVFEVALRLAAFWAAARREQGGDAPLVRITRATDVGPVTTVMSVSDASDWEVLAIMDASRCAYLREGLSRHLGATMSGPRADSWRAAPRSWRDAFLCSSPQSPWRRRGDPAFRGRIGGEPVDAAVAAMEGVVEAADPLKNRLCEPIDQTTLLSLLPDEHTVLLQLYFLDDDLWVLPICRNPGGQPRIVLGSEGFVVRPGVRPRLRDLAARQYEEVARFIQEGMGARTARARGQATTLLQLYNEVWDTLGGGEILELLGQELTFDLNELDLVLVPDGSLCELPLHAVVVNDAGERLYECVRTVRYGLSLQTLRLQQECDELGSGLSGKPWGGLRGVLFADPESADARNALPGVREEAALLVREAPGGWWTHGDATAPDLRATPANFLRRHGSGNLLWAAGHGAELTNEDDEGFALHLCDGQIGPRELLGEAYDFRNVDLFVLSACWLGKVNPGRGINREIESYQAILALRGCKRVTSALWPLSDDAAPRFAAHYFAALRATCFDGRRERNSFAGAFKTAITAFRRDDDGRFDHEFFWAPYTFYGLG